jgi:uncharacterized membrane protein YeaQ/YmgE (transglycosylase-associated protein family)
MGVTGKWDCLTNPPFAATRTFIWEEEMINFIIWILAGALIGWVASIVMRTNGQQGLIADIIVGIVGALVGGYFLSPRFKVETINQGNLAYLHASYPWEAPLSYWRSSSYFVILAAAC